MLTAEQGVEQKVRGLRAGADDYLVEPFHPAELLARIKSLLAQIRPKEERFSHSRRWGQEILAFYERKGWGRTTTI